MAVAPRNLWSDGDSRFTELVLNHRSRRGLAAGAVGAGYESLAVQSRGVRTLVSRGWCDAACSGPRIVEPRRGYSVTILTPLESCLNEHQIIEDGR